jgi:predicted nucleic acid-binding protein
MKVKRQAFNERKLRQFRDILNVDVINVNTDVARKYAAIYLSLQKKGTKIPINDVWIAASCIDVGGTLLTRDRHFEVVDQIDTIILEVDFKEQKKIVAQELGRFPLFPPRQ